VAAMVSLQVRGFAVEIGDGHYKGVTNYKQSSVN